MSRIGICTRDCDEMCVECFQADDPGDCCELCGSSACEIGENGTLFGCQDCGYDAADEVYP